MTTPDRYRPSDAEADNFQRRLRALLLEAVLRVRDEGEPLLALALAEQLEQSRYRLMTRLDIGEDGQPDIGSLWFRVEVDWYGEQWIELVEARWSVFGISEEGPARKPSGPRCRTVSAFPTTCRNWTRRPDRDGDGPRRPAWRPRRGPPTWR